MKRVISAMMRTLACGNPAQVHEGGAMRLPPAKIGNGSAHIRAKVLRQRTARRRTCTGQHHDINLGILTYGSLAVDSGAERSLSFLTNRIPIPAIE